MTTPDEVKNKIIEWCKEDNLSCVVADKSNHLFEIGIGNVAIYCQERLHDRVYFQMQFNFDEKIKKLLANLDNQKKANMINALEINALSLDYNQNILSEQDGKVMTGLRIFKFSATNMTKIEFLRLFLRVQQVGNHANKLLGNTIGVENKLAKAQENQPNSSSVGIQ